MIKIKIPARIDEIGVLLFEPLRNSEDPVRFHLEFDDEKTGTIEFDFDAINISK